MVQLQSVYIFVASCAVVQGALKPVDLARAETLKPRENYRGDDFVGMSDALNGHLTASYSTKPCSEWSLEELQNFQRVVYAQKNGELDGVYQNVTDNRRMRFGSLDEVEGHWEEMSQVLRDAPAEEREELESMRRNAHCHQAVMWLVHHVPDDKKQEMAQVGLVVPLLSESPLVCDGETAGPKATVCNVAEDHETCSWCHNRQSDPSIIPDALDPKYLGPDDGDADCLAQHKDDGEAWRCAPHGWDRNRRCDQDYMPRCGLCEGVGGIAWSDKNEDMTSLNCTIVGTPESVDMDTVAKPVLPKKFTQTGWNEVLIGRKTDPFCFSFFPMNNASGTLCYRREHGTSYYDIEKEATAFVYPQVKMPVFPFNKMPNISSTVTHVNTSMWIVNKLWGGLEQCVCADPGKTMKALVYPSRYDFAKTAAYLGRERIEPEFLNRGVMELDHWNIWAHHIWTDPISQRVVRMWKPWNGLQVLDPDSWTDDITDPTVFNVPPALCKKGGAKFRIGCDDDGNYNGNKTAPDDSEAFASYMDDRHVEALAL